MTFKKNKGSVICSWGGTEFTKFAEVFLHLSSVSKSCHTLIQVSFGVQFFYKKPSSRPSIGSFLNFGHILVLKVS